MTIRFAAPLPGQAPHLAPFLRRGSDKVPGNDNGAVPSDAMLHAALRYFGEHGLAAARRARQQAEAAFFAGDRERYQWWLEVCRTLDRRMGAAAAAVAGGPV